jgi:hypothetical protein
MQPTLEHVDAFSVPSYLPLRIVENYGRSLKEAYGMIREAKRMLYLSVLSQQIVAPSDIVDEAWHEMMLFTRFYQDFSDFIGGFIHHDPTPPEERVNLKYHAGESGLLETDAYTRTKELYHSFFKQKPSKRFWP